MDSTDSTDSIDSIDSIDSTDSMDFMDSTPYANHMQIYHVHTVSEKYTYFDENAFLDWIRSVYDDLEDRIVVTIIASSAENFQRFKCGEGLYFIEELKGIDKNFSLVLFHFYDRQSLRSKVDAGRCY
jgi:hypothetical protein